MGNVVCVLYGDPVAGYPPAYAREEVPRIERYHDGQSAPAPEAIGFEPGELPGSVYSEGDATGGSEEAARFKSG
jgi:formate dehydrogenase